MERPDGKRESGSKPSRSESKRAPWNGTDWYTSFGEDHDGRSWEDARRLGFVSAGGGDWYSNTLKSVPEGAQVWTCIPKVGYVGVGVTTGVAAPYSESWLRDEVGLQGTYVHANEEDEWVLPVEWIKTIPRGEAVWQKGMFANQNSACKLRNEFTLDILRESFGIDEDEE